LSQVQWVERRAECHLHKGGEVVFNEREKIRVFREIMHTTMSRKPRTQPWGMPQKVWNERTRGCYHI